MIGTDSHTPNAGGLGMIAIGVGGADAVDVMAGWPFNTRVPEADRRAPHGCAVGLDRAEGHHPEGRRHPHRQGRHRRDRRVLRPGRAVDLGDRQGDDLQHGRRDRRDLLAVPVRPQHGRVPEGDRSRGDRRPRRPRTPSTSRRSRGRRRPRAVLRPGDRDRPLRRWSRTSSARTLPTSTARSRRSRPRPSARATRSRSRPRSSVRAPTRRTRTSAAPRTSPARRRPTGLTRRRRRCMITPGSEQVRATIERDGLLADLEAIGATVLANACGPCIGQWQRDDIADGRRQHDRHVVQPQLPGPQRRQREHARVHRLAGDGRRHGVERPARRRLPRDALTVDGRRSTPPVADDLPRDGLRPGRVRVRRARRPIPTRVDGRRSRPTRDRLELLAAVPGVGRQRHHGLRVLLKAKGKCTTDHVSPAGKWLHVPRPPHEHLAEPVPRRDQRVHAGEPGMGVDARDGSVEAVARPRPSVQATRASSGSRSATRTTAKARRASTRRWSRATWVAARCSPARSPASQEANLKKQGVLPLTFADPADYDKIRADDVVDLDGLAALAPGQHGAGGGAPRRRHHRRVRREPHAVRRAHRLVQSRLRPQPPRRQTPLDPSIPCQQHGTSFRGT